MFDWFRNKFLNSDRYKTHSEAVIIACFYNPLNSPYRLLAFQKWYRSIKHLNHRIIECTIGENTQPQLPKSKYISHIHTDTLLWHKEALLNKILKELPEKFRYVFWLDTDVLFTNPNWLVEGVAALQDKSIIQPFEFCVHLKRNQAQPDFDVEAHRATVSDPARRHPQLWRSFSANHVTNRLSSDRNYDKHGHVGFAWGARREVLDGMPLYDKALIGGADHIMAHAAAGHIPHECITKSFTDNITEVDEWSRQFHIVTRGRLGYVLGDLYHIWHGDIQSRQYLKRIKDFTPVTKEIHKKDRHGLYVKTGDNRYMEQYYRQREVSTVDDIGFQGFDDGFADDMGYLIWDFIRMVNSPAVSSYGEGVDYGSFGSDETPAPVIEEPRKSEAPSFAPLDEPRTLDAPNMELPAEKPDSENFS